MLPLSTFQPGAVVYFGDGTLWLLYLCWREAPLHAFKKKVEMQISQPWFILIKYMTDNTLESWKKLCVNLDCISL